VAYVMFALDQIWTWL